jgi:outer membrane protein assembly factor BamB
MREDDVESEPRALTRRSLLLAGAAGGASLALGPGLARGESRPSRLHGDDWREAGRDAGATRHDPVPAAGLRAHWSRTLAGGVTGAPAIVGELVFAGSYGGDVTAIELRGGRLRWRRSLGVASYPGGSAGPVELGFFAGPAVAGGRVIIGSDRLRALSASTGATLWEAAPLRAATTQDDYFWGSPTVIGGTVIVGSGAGNEQPTTRGRVSAYRLRDGALLWSTPMVPEGANGGGVIAPVTVDAERGLVFAVTGAPYRPVAGPNPGTCSLVILRLRDGAVVHRDQVFAHDTGGRDFNSAPLLLGHLVVATNKAGVFAWTRRHGVRRLWHRRLTPDRTPSGGPADPTTGPEGGPIATDGRRLFVLSNDAATSTCLAAALAPETGHVLWRTETQGFSFGSPIVVGEEVAQASSAGEIRLLDARTGAIGRVAQLGQPSAAAPASSRGTIVVGTGAGANLPGSLLLALGR